jgi:hypothetical protein
VVIDGATGEPATGVDVRAYPQVWNPSLVSPSMSVGASGAFDISGLAPGSYFLGVGAPPNTRNTTQTAAIMALEVGERDVDNLRLVMTSGVSIRGHLSFEGGVAIDLANSTLRAGLTVSTPSLITWDSSFPIGSGAAIRDSGFTISGIQPGTYRFSLNPILSFQPSPPYDPPREIPDALRNTYVKSVRLGAQEILGTDVRIGNESPGDLEVVIGTNGGAVEGVAEDRRQQTVANGVVVLVPAQLSLRSRSDLSRSATTDAEGRFRIQGIPPGEYKLFCFDYLDDGIWLNPEFMRQFEARGKSVLILERATLNSVVPLIEAGQ